MLWTVTNRLANKFRKFFALSFVVALAGGISVLGLAQLNIQGTRKDVSLVSLDSKIPMASMANPGRSASTSAASQFSTAKASSGKAGSGLSSLPPGAQGPISATLGKDDSGYWVHRSAKGFRGENPRHALVAEFTRQGAEVRSQNLRWVLETRGYGYGDAVHRVRAVAPQVTANRVEYRRDGVTEWYENGPLGLEQGFTLAHPPGKANGQPLTVELTLRGDLAAVLEPTVLGKKSQGLELRRKNGESTLRYTGLTARDATGRELRSWLEVRGERLLVRVKDEGARYPVVVDPWIQQAELTASDGKAIDYFGVSVAISGSTAVVGAYCHPYSTSSQSCGPGAAYVFMESSGTWSKQAELKASDGKRGDGFGGSVAVSGTTIVIGAFGHPADAHGHPGPGAAYVFVQNGNVWSQQAELMASDGLEANGFGGSVAVDGSTAVIGAQDHTVGSNQQEGAAYVFTEGNGTWSQQAELTSSDGAAFNSFGVSVAVSGSTAVVGAWQHNVGSNQYQGAAYVFTESSGTWSQQAELTSSDGGAFDYFGGSVAVSGSTAVVGALVHAVGSNTGQGAAYVFTESGGTWSLQAELTASDGAAGDYLGYSVAVSGSTVVVGAPYHEVGSHNYPGAAYVFVQNGTKWSQQGEVTASDGTSGDSFGDSVAVSDNTAVVAAYLHKVGSNSQQGSAYVFGSPTTVTLSPASLNFGNEAVNGTSAAKTVTLTNTWATLDFSGIAASANFAISANTCGATLAAHKTCKVSVTFTPTQLGVVTGTLSFTDDAQNSPQAVALSGMGIVDATLAPASATYAKQKVGTTSAAKTFTLTNNQPVALTSIAIATSGDFAVSATTCGTSLAAKGKCTVSVTFTPKATGTRTGQLSVSDSASNSPQTSNLKGTGM